MTDLSRPAMIVTAALFAAALAFAPAPSRADNADDPATEDQWQPPPKPCPKGTIWDGRKRICVRKNSGNLREWDRYNYAVWLGKHGFYMDSNTVLSTMKDQKDPKVLTYLGYNHRHLGDWNLGLSYYRKALARDPNYVLAREYLGEGHIKQGRIDLARAELAKIRKICGTTCEAYKDLSQEIAQAEDK